MPRRIAYTYDERSTRYRTRASGRFVSPATVRGAMDSVIRASEERVKALTERFRTREITLGEWESAMRRELRAVHVAAAVTAKGGRDQMSPSDWGKVGSLVKKQFQFLSDRATAVETGKQAPDGSLTGYARMYPHAARSTYVETRGDELTLRGFTEVRSRVHARESCPECLAEQAKDWQAESTYTPIGSRQCLTRCACTEQRRNPLTGEIAA